MNPQYERYRWRTFGVTWLVYASYYFTRQSFSVAKIALDKAPISLSRRDMGLVDSSYLITYSFGQFIFGPLADRYGPKRVLLWGMVLSVIAALGSGSSASLNGFLAFAVLQGIAQSTGWTATSKAMSMWFSLRERGRVLGWWCTHYTAGAAAATPFAGWLMEEFGRRASTVSRSQIDGLYWPAAFWGPAIVVACVAVLMWLLLPGSPEEMGLEPIGEYHGDADAAAEDDTVPALQVPPEELSRESSWQVVTEVMSSWNVWLLGFAYFPIKLARYSFYFWGPKYVEESLGTQAFSSALTAACMPIGGMIGIIVTGYISDNLYQSRRAPISILSLLATAAVMLLGQVHIDNIWLMGAFFFFVGVFLYGPDSLLSATAAIDFGTKRGAGAATGLVNGVGSFGAVVGVYLPGIITSKSDWTTFFAISLGGILLSAAILIPLWRVKPTTS